MYLIAGLGNPGQKYRDTRHNIGRNVVSLIARQMGVSLDGRRFQSRNVRVKMDGDECILLYPTTFMNLSGKAIRRCADFFDLEMEKIIIIHDDLDLHAGKIKIFRHGGAGGHKGIQSIIDYLGGKDFTRIRIGIGRPRYGEAIEEFVLNPFYEDEKNAILNAMQTAVRACRLVVSSGVELAMNQINHKNLGVEEERNWSRD